MEDDPKHIKKIVKKAKFRKGVSAKEAETYIRYVFPEAFQER